MATSPHLVETLAQHPPHHEAHGFAAKNTIYITAPGNPPTATAQMHVRAGVGKKSGKPFVYKTQSDISKKYALVIDALKTHAPKDPIEGPVALTIILYYPWRKEDLKTVADRAKRDKTGYWEWHTTKPDAGNIKKEIEDQMTSLRYWIDDAQVCDPRVLKVRTKYPRVEIIVKELGEPEVCQTL